MRAKIFKILVLLTAFGLPSLAGAQSRRGEDSLTRLGPPSDRYERLIDTSFRHGNAGEYALAEEYLRRAIAERPGHPLSAYLLNNLGGLQELQGKRAEALLSYSAALERRQDEQTTRYNRARLYAALGQRRAAITDYTLLIGQAPRNELYKYQRAMLYIWEGEYNLAEIDLTDILRDNDTSLKARIGYALLETQRGRYAEAERLYEYLVDKLPKSAEVYEGRARLYLLMGKRGFAQRDIERAIALAGTKPTPALYSLWAEIAAASGDKRAAEAARARAEELRGSNN